MQILRVKVEIFRAKSFQHFKNFHFLTKIGIFEKSPSRAASNKGKIFSFFLHFFAFSLLLAHYQTVIKVINNLRKIRADEAADFAPLAHVKKLLYLCRPIQAFG